MISRESDVLHETIDIWTFKLTFISKLIQKQDSFDVQMSIV